MEAKSWFRYARIVADKNRIEHVAWDKVEADLWSAGFASLGCLLTAEECGQLIALYNEQEHFRSRVVMQHHGFGRGEYQYFAYPLPEPVADLREQLYSALAGVANHWMAALDKPADFPADHNSFLDICHENGQMNPTPLLLRYREGDFNCLHQDVYGDIVFIFQVIFSLSQPGVDFDGGELMLVEQRPRAQSVGHVLLPQRGEAVVITTRYRPVSGKRGFYRSNLRHGVSAVRRGERYTLGVIFHDAA